MRNKRVIAIASLITIFAIAPALASDGEVFFEDVINTEVRIYETSSGRQILPDVSVPSFRTSASSAGYCPNGGPYQFAIGLVGHSGAHPDPYFALLTKEVWYTLVFVGQGRIYFRAPLTLQSPTDAVYGIWGASAADCTGATNYKLLDWPSADYGPVLRAATSTSGATGSPGSPIGPRSSARRRATRGRW